ncbi:hypothetical protein [Sabulibacter ruber]|uniref:hypothetical protein n=1 Tax=Sabulibacter ruber TaxID=2811901 RepID=UPI001A96861A|nr:hypothetical protein [Sabulibacter ruber]
MKKALFLLPFLLLTFLCTQAQETTLVITSSSQASPKRYLGMVELGYLYQDNKNNIPNTADSSPTLVVFNGYQFHRLVAVGLTIGSDFYNNLLVTPVALGLRGTLLNTRVSPYYSLDAGYGSTFLSNESDQLENEGGWMLNPALGLRVQSGNNTALAFSLGYKVQRAQTTNSPWSGTTITDEVSFKRVSVRLGFQF